MSPAENFKVIVDSFNKRIGQENVLENFEDPKDPRLLTVRVNPGKIVQIAELMKELDFPYLSFITAVDFKTHIEMVYWFTSLSTGFNVRVKCNLPPTNPQIESLAGSYSTANWNEREVYDLFGVNFLNHPEMTRILTWEGFDGHPLLKKYKVIDDPDEFPKSPGSL